MTLDLDRLRLARAEGVGPITYRRLMRRYASAAAALEALPGLARTGGRDRPPFIPSRDAAEREFEQAGRARAALIFVDTPGYPGLLGLLDDAPAVLAVQGRPDLLDARAVAMVGSRNASANGRRLAEDMAEALAKAGLVVVSGLARGIDAAAHEGALRAGAHEDALRTGTTVACVAGGIDMPYPPEHADLQARIARAGAVVAEAPPGTAPQSRHFPRRNRIIAGLSLGVVVVEAALRSGSLITARLAQEAGREIYAVPGSPLDPRCRGANDLIRQGAHLVETAADVVADLPEHPGAALGQGPRFAPRGALLELQEQPPAPADPDADPRALARILGLLGPSPTAVDELIRSSQVPANAVMAVLLGLELAGRVEMQPGNMVALLADPGH